MLFVEIGSVDDFQGQQYFLLKKGPRLCWLEVVILVLREGDQGHYLLQPLLLSVFLYPFPHGDPPFLLGLCPTPKVKLLQIMREIESVVGQEELPVLNHKKITYSGSSQQGPWMWWRAPLGMVFRRW